LERYLERLHHGRRGDVACTSLDSSKSFRYLYSKNEDNLLLRYVFSFTFHDGNFAKPKQISIIAKVCSVIDRKVTGFSESFLNKERCPVSQNSVLILGRSFLVLRP
jgi:hypothetical protein